MPEGTLVATYDYQPGHVADVLEFLKRTRNELRGLHRVRISRDWVQVIDINGDYFEVRGLGYVDDDASAVLQNVNAVFKPASLKQNFAGPFKEFKAGKRYPWAQDRVM